MHPEILRSRRFPSVNVPVPYASVGKPPAALSFGRLARIFHAPSTAAAQSRLSADFSSVGLLDVVLTTPAQPSVGKVTIQASLDRLATNQCEICGLGDLPKIQSRILGPRGVSGMFLAAALAGDPDFLLHGQPCRVRRRITGEPILFLDTALKML